MAERNEHIAERLFLRIVGGIEKKLGFQVYRVGTRVVPLTKSYVLGQVVQDSTDWLTLNRIALLLPGKKDKLEREWYFGLSIEPGDASCRVIVRRPKPCRREICVERVTPRRLHAVFAAILELAHTDPRSGLGPRPDAA